MKQITELTSWDKRQYIKAALSKQVSVSGVASGNVALLVVHAVQLSVSANLVELFPVIMNEAVFFNGT